MPTIHRSTDITQYLPIMNGYDVYGNLVKSKYANTNNSGATNQWPYG